MSLPKINTPVYTTTMPSKGKTIEFRPFLVKEEKIMMMAKEAKDFASIISSVRKVMESCTFGKYDFKNICTTDFEWFFLKLREVSVGEIIELQKICNVDVKDSETGETKKCGGIVNFDINIKDDIEPPVFVKDANKIPLDETITVVLRYPSFDILENIKTKEDIDETKIIASMIEFVIDGAKVYDTAKEDPKEIIEFVESFTSSQKNKIKEFINSTPQIVCKKKWKCPKCGEEGEYTFKGIKDFFG